MHVYISVLKIITVLELRTARSLHANFNEIFFFTGIDSGRLKKIIANLNLQFSILVETKSIELAYMEVITTNPYAILARSTYDLQPQPIQEEKEYDPESSIHDDGVEDEPAVIENEKKGENPEVGNDRDVEDEFFDEGNESDEEIRDHIVKFPTHAEFLLKFRNAKIAADRANKRAYVCWRGHKTSLPPNGPAMTYSSFKLHVLNALKNIKKKSESETKVKICFKKKKKCRS